MSSTVTPSIYYRLPDLLILTIVEEYVELKKLIKPFELTHAWIYARGLRRRSFLSLIRIWFRHSSYPILLNLRFFLQLDPLDSRALEL